MEQKSYQVIVIPYLAKNNKNLHSIYFNNGKSKEQLTKKSFISIKKHLNVMKYHCLFSKSKLKPN